MNESTSFPLVATTRDGQRIVVAVRRKQVRNLNLRVRADGSVVLSIPLRTTRAHAERFVQERADWIAERLRRAHARQPDTLTLQSQVPLWGRLVPLADLIEHDGLPCDGNGTAEEGDALQEQLREHLQERLQAVYAREVAVRLPQVAHELEELMGVHASRWSVRHMRTRWGSCTPATRAIRINAALAAYPPACLACVVAHELTHLVEPRHDARFYAFLEQHYPKARAVSALLKRPARDVAISAAKPTLRRSAGDAAAPTAEPTQGTPLTKLTLHSLS